MILEKKITRNLTNRYLTALVLVASLSAAAWFSLQSVISAQEDTGALVNVSGRQRMLSQRTDLYANLLVSSPKAARPEIRAKLSEAIELMASSHFALTHGSMAMKLPSTMSPTIRSMYFDGPNALDVQVRTYVQNVRDLLSQSDEALTSDSPLLQYINRTAPNLLVTSLDRMVHQYQLEGEASVRSLQRSETLIFLLTLLLLVLEGTLIFYPFTKQLKGIIGRFEKVRVELQNHHDTLEDVVSQRTSELEAKTNALVAGEEQLRLVLAGAQLGFWDWNIATGEVERNARWAEMLGYTYEEIKHTAQQWLDFIHPDDREKAWNSINAVLEGRSSAHNIEYRMLHKDGSIRWILDQANVMQRDINGKPTRMSGTHTDVTERKNLELELERQAHIDYLTGVSNRGHFVDQADLELSRAVRYGKSLSLLMLDIDFFKQVNDTHGHKAGDSVLVKLAEVCRKTMRDVDIIGRLGGEEFAILLPETGIHEATEAAERLRVALESTKVPLEDGLPLNFTVSVGVATQQSKDDNIDVLLNLADKALYEAKRTGRNKVCVTEQ